MSSYLSNDGIPFHIPIIQEYFVEIRDHINAMDLVDHMQNLPQIDRQRIRCIYQNHGEQYAASELLEKVISSDCGIFISMLRGLQMTPGSENVVRMLMGRVPQQILDAYLLTTNTNSGTILPKEDKFIDNISHSKFIELCQELSIETQSHTAKDWRHLPQMLGIQKEVKIRYIQQYHHRNPAEEILLIWAKKRTATVSNLYRILMENGLESAAAIIQSEVNH